MAHIVVLQPMRSIEKCEEIVYKLVQLVQDECTSITLATILREIQQSVNSSRASAEERLERLSSWINGIETKDTYETALRYRHEGTCEWVLELEALQSWRSAGPTRARLLWIHGPAGFGKTFMSAWIIHNLKGQIDGPLSFHFCVADNQQTRDPYAILRSWLMQILKQNEDVHPVMYSTFTNRDKEKTLTQIGLWELFVAVGEAVPGCTFVVDGFDECTNINSGMRYHQNDPRGYFLRDLMEHLPKTKSRVLVVSRDVTDIREYLHKDSTSATGVDMFEHRVTARDTTPDVQSFSECIVNQKLSKKAENLRRTIAAEASKRSAGMFLWIKLLEKEISPGQNAKQLSATVQKMPSGIGDAYSREIQRIAKLPREHRLQAVTILRWILFAIRPLRVKELAEALAVSSDELEQYPEDDMPDAWQDGFVDENYVKENILEKCGSLLQLRSKNPNAPIAEHTIQFVHFSAKEYLMNMPDIDPNNDAGDLRLTNRSAQDMWISKVCHQ